MLRRAAASFVLATLLTSFGYSQGLVYFFNTSSTLILTNGSGPVQGPGNYYFGLFIAEPGATDPSQFVFTGIYATNLSAAGRINGGSAVVPNWLPGQIKSYQVRGWSANLGHDWEKVKDALIAYFPFGFYGSSAIAQGTAGGFDGTNTLPTLFLFGAAGGLGGFSLNQFGMEPMSARLLSRPPDQTVRQWQDVSMGVSVTGLPPIYYTWYFNGQVIPGATVNPLVIPRVQLTNAGTYSVAVTNPYGGMKSAATLTVIPSDEPPYIVAQPQSQSVDAGSNVTLRVQAGGALPLFYQWRFENAELTGENSKELTLVNVQMSHAGSYAVVITNTGGAITSAVANVIVRPPPGHGLVQFLNSAGTLTVTNASTVGGTSGPTAPIPNLYYFGLFLGPPGMTNQAEFTFSGAYATNQAFAGGFPQAEPLNSQTGSREPVVLC